MNTVFQNRKIDVYLLCAIVLIPLAVFSPVLWHDFVNYDDPAFIYANPHIQYGMTVESIRWAFTSTRYEANWIPLTWISQMLDVQMFGMRPGGHHAVNVLFHAANSAVLFIFLNRATKAPLKSAAVAFLFALHPLHVQSVAWAAERKDVLSTFFWMLTLYAYLVYSEKRGVARYIAVLVTFSLGLLSKSMVVTLPVVLLLIDWWPLRRYVAETETNVVSLRSITTLLVEKVPLFILSVATAVITVSAQQSIGGIVTAYPFMERVGRACISYIEYVYKMFWPSKLSVFYPFVEHSPSVPLVSISLLALLLIFFAVVLSGKRYPFLIVGWLWYVVTLLPVIGLIQVGDHAIADRYTYIPLTGIFVMTVWGISELAKRWIARQNVLGVAAALTLIGMIFVSSMEISHWKNSFTLLSHAVEVTENNWLAWNNLGLEYLKKGRVDDAILCFQEAVKAKPTYVLALVNLGALYPLRNQNAQAIGVLQRALQYDPGNEKASLLLSLLLPQK